MRSTGLSTVPSDTLKEAIVRRLGQLHDDELGVDVAAVDCHASFFAPTGFRIGDHVLDSLDIVEMIVALEVDFDVSIVETRDVTQYDSIAKLSVLLEEIAGQAELESFERQWT
jgi:acyl carrier protein